MITRRNAMFDTTLAAIGVATGVQSAAAARLHADDLQTLDDLERLQQAAADVRAGLLRANSADARLRYRALHEVLGRLTDLAAYSNFMWDDMQVRVHAAGQASSSPEAIRS